MFQNKKMQRWRSLRGQKCVKNVKNVKIECLFLKTKIKIKSMLCVLFVVFCDIFCSKNCEAAKKHTFIFIHLFAALLIIQLLLLLLSFVTYGYVC